MMMTMTMMMRLMTMMMRLMTMIMRLMTIMMSSEMLMKTGKEKKSMRKPRRRKPAMRITIPVKKVSRMAYLGLGYN